MKCPKCKTELSDFVLRCPSCGIKVRAVCPKCDSINPINALKCQDCGKELLKKCEKCGALNVPTAKVCRKCGASISKVDKFIERALKKNVKIEPEKSTFEKSYDVMADVTSDYGTIETPAEELFGEIKKTTGLEPIKQEDAEPVVELITPDEIVIEKTDAEVPSPNAFEREFGDKARIDKPIYNEENFDIEIEREVAPPQIEEPVAELYSEEIKQDTNDSDNEADKDLIEEEVPQVEVVQTELPNENDVQEEQIIQSQDEVEISENTDAQVADLSDNLKDSFEVVEEKLEEDESVKLEKISPIVAEKTIVLSNRQEAKKTLIEAIKSEDVRIISLSGDAGIGKTLVLKCAANEVKGKQQAWIYAKATPLTQLTPCGVIQDALLEFFNVEGFCENALKVKKESFRFFHHEFPALTNNEIFNLLNFLYPVESDYYEKLYINKENTFVILTKVFDKLSENNKIVFVVDNFDEIDGMSYEFLSTFIQKTPHKKNIKIIMTYTDVRPAKGYLNVQEFNEDAYIDIPIGKLTKPQMEQFVSQYGNVFEKLDTSLKNIIYDQCGGNPAYLEQLLNLVSDCDGNFDEFPLSFDDVIKFRLKNLKKIDKNAYRFIAAAAVLGVKFSHQMLTGLLSISQEDYARLLEILVKLNFIQPINDYYFEFKNKMVWNGVLNFAKSEDDFQQINGRLYEIVSAYTLSSHVLLAVISQNMNQKLGAFSCWTEVMKLASYVGDVSLYVIAQKQSLTLMNELEGDPGTVIKNNINERLGKVLSLINPHEAMEYLPNAIAAARDSGNLYKEIELMGYLAKCSMKCENYFGAVECIEETISRLDANDFELEIAIMKSRSISALMKIGNFAQVVNMIDNEILPVFEKYLDTSKLHKIVSIDMLFEAWLHTYLNFAISLAAQGHNRSFEVINVLFDIIEKNNITDSLFICKAKLALAFANTMRGDVGTSENILEELLKIYRMDTMDDVSILEWNVINIINRLVHRDYKDLGGELFHVVTFANNLGDNVTKKILKVLLGKMFKEQDQARHSLEIYDEEISYFAKEKNSIGALITWYLIADATLVVDGPNKTIEISRKALDVAQSPKINNFYFIVLFNKLMAESYMALSDYETAKIHIEKAILFARKFDMLDLLAQCYLLYGKYLQDLAIPDTDLRESYLVGASKLFKKSMSIAREVRDAHLIKDIEKANAVLKSFCQLNNVVLR